MTHRRAGLPAGEKLLLVCMKGDKGRSKQGQVHTSQSQTVEQLTTDYRGLRRKHTPETELIGKSFGFAEKLPQIISSFCSAGSSKVLRVADDFAGKHL